MLIRSLANRPTTITFTATGKWPAGEYTFTLADPGDPASPLVCEVGVAAHIERLLSIVEGYREFHGTVKPAFARPSPTPDNGAVSAAGLESTEHKLNTLSVRDLRALLATGAVNGFAISEALDAEKAAEAPRRSVVALLTKALKDLEPPAP